MDSPTQSTQDVVPEGSPESHTQNDHLSRRLDIVDAMVKHGAEPEITGRELLKWFGAERRGSRVVAWIRSELLQRGLVTEPDFAEVWVDVPIRIKRVQIDQTPDSGKPPSPGAPSTVATTLPAQSALEPQKMVDPIRRLSQLRAANQKVVSVTPSTSLKEAMTIMMLNEFSQLPVIQGDRQCKGAVTWQSIATATALGNECNTVNDCLVPATELQWDMDLLEAIPKVVESGFALIKGRDNRFQGIVTVVDLSLQFKDLSEPFLLLEQIENLLRIQIGKCFTIEELRKAKHSADTSRDVNSVSDLTFGEYVRLLEPMDAWSKLKFTFDRGPFLVKLKEVQDCRNDVMHFDPDPLSAEDVALLRNFAAFLKRVVA
jgi:CBS domain-containing protein